MSGFTAVHGVFGGFLSTAFFMRLIPVCIVFVCNFKRLHIDWDYCKRGDVIDEESRSHPFIIISSEVGDVKLSRKPVRFVVLLMH